MWLFNLLFSSFSQLWYVEVRLSWSISVSPSEFEITRADCIFLFLHEHIWAAISENIPLELCAARIQISLHIRAVWSETSLGIFLIAKDAYNKDIRLHVDSSLCWAHSRKYIFSRSGQYVHMFCGLINITSLKQFLHLPSTNSISENLKRSIWW